MEREFSKLRDRLQEIRENFMGLWDGRIFVSSRPYVRENAYFNFIQSQFENIQRWNQAIVSEVGYMQESLEEFNRNNRDPEALEVLSNNFSRILDTIEEMSSLLKNVKSKGAPSGFETHYRLFQNTYYAEFQDVAIPLQNIFDLILEPLSEEERTTVNTSIIIGERTNPAIYAFEAETNRIRKERSKMCFIATAAYGTPMAEEIDVLRHFRDKHLLTHSLGKILVQKYYETSPNIAHRIAERDNWKTITRSILSPIVFTLRTLLR